MRALLRRFWRSSTSPSWIEAADLAKQLGGDGLLVLDVRGPDEFTGALGHIDGALNLPLDQLSTRLTELTDRERPVVVVCKTDRRSSIAAEQLQNAGIADVAVLRGGMEQWHALGLPVC